VEIKHHSSTQAGTCIIITIISVCHHPFRGNIISLCFSTHSLKARTWWAQTSDLVGCSW